jgi:hypothetical protein
MKNQEWVRATYGFELLIKNGWNLKYRHVICLSDANPSGMIYIGMTTTYNPNRKDFANDLQEYT